uniref:Uncharacterized protein n=1 Tax=Salix viminalis TaxID=40686 RepID=A0A6N2M7R5_SALVM
MFSRIQGVSLKSTSLSILNHHGFFLCGWQHLVVNRGNSVFKLFSIM